MNCVWVCVCVLIYGNIFDAYAFILWHPKPRRPKWSRWALGWWPPVWCDWKRASACRSSRRRSCSSCPWPTCERSAPKWCSPWDRSRASWRAGTLGSTSMSPHRVSRTGRCSWPCSPGSSSRTAASSSCRRWPICNTIISSNHMSAKSSEDETLNDDVFTWTCCRWSRQCRTRSRTK